MPVKELRLAKSRLHHLEAGARSALALAMASDVVAAARAARSVTAVVVVTNDVVAAARLEELGARVVADVTDSGLDDALENAARTAAALWPRCGVVALSSDLPCASAAALDRFLERAAGHERAVLADRLGDGTTLLAAAPGVALNPRYGAASRARHVLDGAHQVAAAGLERLTLDVDTPADLEAALALGVGPHTSAVMLPADDR